MQSEVGRASRGPRGGTQRGGALRPPPPRRGLTRDGALLAAPERVEDPVHVAARRRHREPLRVVDVERASARTRAPILRAVAGGCLPRARFAKSGGKEAGSLLLGRERTTYRVLGRGG